MSYIIVGEQIIHRGSNIVVLRRFLKGWHPELGLLHWGLSGPETIMEVMQVPARLFTIESSGRSHE